MYHVVDDLADKDAAAEEELNSLDVVILQPPRVRSVTFPTYMAPNVKDDMVGDSRQQHNMPKCLRVF